MPPFWCAARLMPKREAVATQCLTLAGFETYMPRLRECRMVRGRRVEISPPLFPGYIFILVVSRWYDAKWCPGVASLIMNGAGPARVPDSRYQRNPISGAWRVDRATKTAWAAAW